MGMQIIWPQPPSQLQRLFHVAGLAARQRQIGTCHLQHVVNEDARNALHRANDLVLRAQRDQHVFNAIVQAQHAHGLHFGPHDLGRSGRRQLHVQA